MSFLVNSFPFIQQLSAMECGTTSLAIILKHYGYANIRGFLKDYAEVSTEGVDLVARPNIKADAKAYFEKKTKGKPYKSPIPGDQQVVLPEE